MVCVGERLGELVEESFRSCISVRLEYTPHAVVRIVLRSLERRFDFCRVMRVVVYYRHAALAGAVLSSPSSASKLAKLESALQSVPLGALAAAAASGPVASGAGSAVPAWVHRWLYNSAQTSVGYLLSGRVGAPLKLSSGSGVE